MKQNELRWHGSPVIRRFDSEAIPDVMSVAICSRLHVAPTETNRRIIMVKSRDESVVGEVTRVLVTVRQMMIQFSCLVVRSSSYDLIIESPSVQKMRASLDSVKNICHAQIRKNRFYGSTSNRRCDRFKRGE